MSQIKELWQHSSIKKKLMILSIILMTIMLISEGTAMALSMSALREFEDVMTNNSTYNELQEVIKEEQELFLNYIRNRTDENKVAYEEACSNTKTCICELPFEYSELGEERYARTWNIISGYNGYIKYRDQLLTMTERDPAYIRTLYEVLDMQDSLSNYALKLVQVTLEQWDTVYAERMRLLDFIPVAIGIVILVMLVFDIISWKILSKNIISPIMRIAEDSRVMAKTREVTKPLAVENKDEIGDLVIAFNLMKEATARYIHTLEEKNRVTELLHREELAKIELETRVEQAQLEMLKQQVNPHFLFNTLNMISSMAKLEDAEVTDKMIISLSNLFRYNLRTVEQEVFLEQELEALDDYIYIQQMRFDNRVRYEKNINVDKNKVRVPSYMLQPIVENAFIHGVSSLEDGGKIMVRIWEEGSYVYIEIEDNGIGMDAETLKYLNEQIHKTNTERSGVGLGNICRRIQMMYQDGAVTIESTKGKGTTVKLVIPQNS